jgi:hypothetical protein
MCIAKLNLCIALAAGGFVFAALAMPVQPAAAQTVNLRRAVISAGHDAQALTPVVVAERRIIAQGVQLVPQSASQALQVMRLDGQLLKLDSAITHEAARVGAVRNINSPAGRKVIGTAASATRLDITKLADDAAGAKAAALPLARSFDLGGFTAGRDIVGQLARLTTGLVRNVFGGILLRG